MEKEKKIIKESENEKKALKKSDPVANGREQIVDDVQMNKILKSRKIDKSLQIKLKCPELEFLVRAINWPIYLLCAVNNLSKEI